MSKHSVTQNPRNKLRFQFEANAKGLINQTPILQTPKQQEVKTKQTHKVEQAVDVMKNIASF
jgi:hypothetical protein